MDYYKSQKARFLSQETGFLMVAWTFNPRVQCIVIRGLKARAT
jgi:hypothetical protein